MKTIVALEHHKLNPIPILGFMPGLNRMEMHIYTSNPKLNCAGRKWSVQSALNDIFASLMQHCSCHNPLLSYQFFRLFSVPFSLHLCLYPGRFLISIFFFLTLYIPLALFRWCACVSVHRICNVTKTYKL